MKLRFPLSSKEHLCSSTVFPDKAESLQQKKKTLINSLPAHTKWQADKVSEQSQWRMFNLFSKDISDISLRIQ